MSKAKANYDITAPDGRLNYIKDCIELLAAEASPTEQDVYAGRLSQETGVAKSAIMAQMETAVRGQGRRRSRQIQRDLLKEGVAASIQLPRGITGQQALGVAVAEQQLVAAVLKQPELMAQVAGQVRADRFILPELSQAWQVMTDRWKAGEPFELSTLSCDLPDSVMAMLSRILAQNHGMGFGKEDIELYLGRIRTGTMTSGAAAEMDAGQLAGYLEQLRKKKRPTEHSED